MAVITLTGLKYAAAQYFVDAMNAKVGSGALLRFYTGSAPADPSDPPTGVLVASCAMGSPPFTYPGTDQWDTNAIADDTNTSAGTVGYFRVEDSGGTAWIQGECADDASKDFDFDSLVFANGDTLVIDLFNGGLTLAP